MRLGKKATVAGIAALALTLAACGGSGSGSNSSSDDNSSKAPQQSNKDVPADWNPQPRDNVKDGGTWTRAITEIPAQMNAFQADGSAYTTQLWTWFNPQMTFFTPDGEWSYNKDYLKDVKEETKDGNTVITYTLNPKSKWNNGDPITWKSFETTWKANNGKNEKYHPNSTDGWKRIKSVKKGEDERQAVVTFDGEYAWWQALYQNILNPHVDSPKVYNKGYVNKAHPEWGAGPFKIDKYDPKRGVMSFKRNPNWWGPKAKLDKMTFKQMESTAAINAFKNHEIDMTSVGTKDRLKQVKNMKNITIHRAGTTSRSLIELQSKSPKLKDLKVRKAIFQGIDRKVIQKIQFQGLNYSEEAPGSFMDYPFQDGYRNNLKKAGYKYSEDDANKLLDEAGWKKGKDGVRKKDGKKLSLRAPVIGDDPTTEATAKAVQSMLKKIGVEYKIEKKPSSAFSKVFTSDDWDMFSLGFTSGNPYDGIVSFCQIYCSTSTDLNRSHTVPKKFDKKIKKMEHIADKKKQKAKANDLEVEIMKNSWGIFPTINGPTIYATKKGAANLAPAPYSVSGPDLFGVHAVENAGWQKGKTSPSASS